MTRSLDVSSCLRCADRGGRTTRGGDDRGASQNAATRASWASRVSVGETGREGTRHERQGRDGAGVDDIDRNAGPTRGRVRGRVAPPPQAPAGWLPRHHRRSEDSGTRLIAEGRDGLLSHLGRLVHRAQRVPQQRHRLIAIAPAHSPSTSGADHRWVWCVSCAFQRGSIPVAKRQGDALPEVVSSSAAASCRPATGEWLRARRAGCAARLHAECYVHVRSRALWKEAGYQQVSVVMMSRAVRANTRQGVRPFRYTAQVHSVAHPDKNLMRNA